MKILLATEVYWPYHDGGAVFERALVHGLVTLGHEVRVVAPSFDGPPSIEQDEGSQIHRLRSRRLPGKFGKHGPRATLRPQRAIAALLDEWQPDVIHAHNPFPIGRAVSSLARSRRIPLVLTNHNIPENALANLYLPSFIKPGEAMTNWLWKEQVRFLNRANFVTSPTQTAVDLLLSHGLSVPSEAISNGVDAKRFRVAPASKELRHSWKLPDKPLVLYVGRLDGEKKMDVWLRSIPEVLKEIDAHFVIGGKGTEAANLQRLAQKLDVADHVTFVGVVPSEDLPAFYNLGTVFAIASPAELQSLVTLEAMASGLPIVACDATALPELCKSGRNGYLFLPGDPAGMAKSLIRILRNPSMAERMGQESRRIIEADHDVQQMPQRYAEIYQKVASLGDNVT